MRCVKMYPLFTHLFLFLLLNPKRRLWHNKGILSDKEVRVGVRESRGFYSYKTLKQISLTYFSQSLSLQNKCKTLNQQAGWACSLPFTLSHLPSLHTIHCKVNIIWTLHFFGLAISPACLSTHITTCKCSICLCQSLL